MTPYQINLLLQIHTTPIAPKPCDALDDAIALFRRDDLIEDVPDEDEVRMATKERTHDWRLTLRGQAYLRMLTNLPLPQQAWIDPRTKAVA